MVEEAGAFALLWGFIKWASAPIIGLICWAIRGILGDMKALRDDIHKHEVESANKFGMVEANVKTLTDTLPRIHERLDEIMNFLMSKK